MNVFNEVLKREYILGVPLVRGELEYRSTWEVIDDDEVDVDEEVF